MKAFTLLFFVILGTSVALANDVKVSNATLIGQNVTAGANNPANFTLVQFDLTWSNSWRVNTGPSNWDAVWVFVKYRIEGGTGCVAGNWQHATLSIVGADHLITTNNGVPGNIDPSSDAKGVFMYRSGNGTGNNNWAGVKLRWNYGADGLLDACNVSIKVFAMEMVYVPQGSFFAGDGAATNGAFEAGVSGAAYLVTSEAAITLGGGGAGSLGNHNRTGQAQTDDYTNAASQTLPAAFPKGFFQFYCMKYEISQEQYAEFLNVLTPTQQLLRHGATAIGRYITNVAAPPNRNGIKCTTLPVVGTNTVGIYSLDLNNNGVFNETTDGQNVACGVIEGQDLLAYLDWSALRPMTELELEKATRGTLPAVPGEYAWGSASLYASSYAPLINGGMGTELPTSPASGTSGNAAYSTTANVAGIQGPMRVGIFAIASSSRVDAGASYYGIMELTGNVWELPVGVGQVAGRSFTGLHGNGSLDAAGNANQDFWPGVNGNSTWTVANTAYAGTGSSQVAGLQFRGGSFLEALYLKASDRTYSYWTGINGRDNRNGGRGVRTAP